MLPVAKCDIPKTYNISFYLPASYIGVYRNLWLENEKNNLQISCIAFNLYLNLHGMRTQKSLHLPLPAS
jgi:hypothetical protein